MDIIELTPEQVAAANVKRGAALITEYYEGDKSWMRRLDLDRLQIVSPFACVLGQLFPTYTTGLGRLGIYGYDRAVANGFCSNNEQGLTNDLLTATWRELIKRELAA